MKHHTCIAADVSFLGDVLLKIDFLRKVDFCLILKNQPFCAHLLLNDSHFNITYAGDFVTRLKNVTQDDTDLHQAGLIHVVEDTITELKCRKFVSVLLGRSMKETSLVLLS